MLDEEDRFMVQKIKKFERKYAKYTIKFKCETQYVDIKFQQNENYNLQTVCRLRMKPNIIEAYKTDQFSGFDAFGIQFETLNKFEMYFTFVGQLRSAIETYTKHPVFAQSNSKYFERLREIIRGQRQQEPLKLYQNTGLDKTPQ